LLTHLKFQLKEEILKDLVLSEDSQPIVQKFGIHPTPNCYSTNAIRLTPKGLYQMYISAVNEGEGHGHENEDANLQGEEGHSLWYEVDGEMGGQTAVQSPAGGHELYGNFGLVQAQEHAEEGSTAQGKIPAGYFGTKYFRALRESFFNRN
jgi:hypothetical protein